MIDVAATMQEETQRELPDGWRWVRLGDVFKVRSGNFLPAKLMNQAGTYPVYGGNGVSGYHDTYMFDEPKIVIGRVGAQCGCIHRCQPRAWVTDNALYVAEKLVDFDDQFMAFWLTHLNLNAYANSMAQPLVTGQIIYPIEVPFPPLAEQKRIAAILTEQMAAIEQARVAAEAQLAAAKELPAAYLRAVFESDEVQEWPKVRLGEVGQIGAGITLNSNQRLANTRTVPYLRVANVKDGYFDLDDVFEVEATDADIRKCTLHYGDLLLTEGGDPDKLGRGTFWQGQIPECLHQNHIFRVRFDLGRFSPAFLAAQISSYYGKKYFLAHAKQTTGIATINQRVLGAFPLMAPPLEIQQKIASRLAEQTAAAEQTRQVLESQLATINQLPAALLRRAFAGEL
jgi:type I restriction enzyme S subunit